MDSQEPSKDAQTALGHSWVQTQIVGLSLTGSLFFMLLTDWWHAIFLARFLVCLFGLMLNVPVNSYGYVSMVSSPNHTFFPGKLDQ